jgi:hypothetical protein
MAPFEQRRLHRISHETELTLGTPTRRKRVHAMRWRKAGRRWIAVDGHTRCEVNPPRDPNEPIQRYFWSVKTSSNTASGATSSLTESQQAAEQEAAVLNRKEQMK